MQIVCVCVRLRHCKHMAHTDAGLIMMLKLPQREHVTIHTQFTALRVCACIVSRKDFLFLFRYLKSHVTLCLFVTFLRRVIQIFVQHNALVFPV